MLVVSASAVVALSACGQQHSNPAAAPAPPTVPGKYPTLADYNTLRSARAMVNQALFVERDWRRQAFAAYLGLNVMMTMHPLQPGPCFDFVSRTYNELLSLHDNYRGEDWGPLVAMVRRDPPVTVCRATPPLKLSAIA
jgi:hypothetical protein